MATRSLGHWGRSPSSGMAPLSRGPDRSRPGSGQAGQIVSELEVSRDEHPLRERLVRHQALRSGTDDKVVRFNGVNSNTDILTQVMPDEFAETSNLW